MRQARLAADAARGTEGLDHRARGRIEHPQPAATVAQRLAVVVARCDQHDVDVARHLGQHGAAHGVAHQSPVGGVGRGWEGPAKLRCCLAGVQASGGADVERVVAAPGSAQAAHQQLGAAAQLGVGGGGVEQGLVNPGPLDRLADAHQGVGRGISPLFGPRDGVNGVQHAVTAGQIDHLLFAGQQGLCVDHRADQAGAGAKGGAFAAAVAAQVVDHGAVAVAGRCRVDRGAHVGCVEVHTGAASGREDDAAAPGPGRQHGGRRPVAGGRHRRGGDIDRVGLEVARPTAWVVDTQVGLRVAAVQVDGADRHAALRGFLVQDVVERRLHVDAQGFDIVAQVHAAAAIDGGVPQVVDHRGVIGNRCGPGHRGGPDVRGERVGSQRKQGAARAQRQAVGGDVQVGVGQLRHAGGAAGRNPAGRQVGTQLVGVVAQRKVSQGIGDGGGVGCTSAVGGGVVAGRGFAVAVGKAIGQDEHAVALAGVLHDRCVGVELGADALHRGVGGRARRHHRVQVELAGHDAPVAGCHSGVGVVHGDGRALVEGHHAQAQAGQVFQHPAHRAGHHQLALAVVGEPVGEVLQLVGVAAATGVAGCAGLDFIELQCCGAVRCRDAGGAVGRAGLGVPKAGRVVGDRRPAGPANGHGLAGRERLGGAAAGHTGTVGGRAVDHRAWRQGHAGLDVKAKAVVGEVAVGRRPVGADVQGRGCGHGRMGWRGVGGCIGVGHRRATQIRR